MLIPPRTPGRVLGHVNMEDRQLAEWPAVVVRPLRSRMRDNVGHLCHLRRRKVLKFQDTRVTLDVTFDVTFVTLDVTFVTFDVTLEASGLFPPQASLREPLRSPCSP